MKLLLVEEILEDLKGSGINISKALFYHYYKNDLIFSHDKKTKKRWKEGMKVYFAEENVERIKFIHDLKDEGLSLKEIHGKMLEKDREYISTLLDDLGISADGKIIPHHEDPRIIRPDIDLIVSTWRKEGFYRGLLTIYNIMLLTAMNLHTFTPSDQQTLPEPPGATEAAEQDAEDGVIKKEDTVEDKIRKLHGEYTKIYDFLRENEVIGKV